MLIKINTKKYTADIEYINDKNITLKSGATLGNESPSLDPKLKTLRKTYAPSNTLTADLTFKSKSAIASFIVGSPQSGNRFFATYLGNNQPQPQVANATQPQVNTNSVSSDAMFKDKLAKSIITFCKDFELKPDNRCLNTMKYVEDINDYLLSFMELTNYPTEMLDLAKSKFQSSEWKDIVNKLNNLKSNYVINHRLIIKYGSAGTGKTTDAIREYPNAQKIVASASADPDDLFTRFDPSTKSYVLTELGNAMANGLPIIIDEMNLFNQVVMQRLQGCLDNTINIVDRGIVIEIKDGFVVIGTMNLETNLGKTPLPNPLVSRAMKIENYDTRVSVNLSWVW